MVPPSAPVTGSPELSLYSHRGGEHSIVYIGCFLHDAVIPRIDPVGRPLSRHLRHTFPFFSQGELNHFWHHWVCTVYCTCPLPLVASICSYPPVRLVLLLSP